MTPPHKYSVRSENKHELIQVAVTANVTLHKSGGSSGIPLQDAIRFQNGKPPFKRNFRKKFSANNNGSNKTPNTVICRYCKKPGHIQKDCRKRLRENGAMVDAGGKPFEKRVNVTQNEASSKVENEEMMKRANNVGSIVSGALNSLNW